MANTIDLAQYKYTLTLDDSQYSKGMAEAEQSASKMKSKLGGVGSFLKGAFVTGLAGAGVAIAGCVTKGVKSFASYEESLNKVKTIADTTAMSMDDISAGIKDVSNEVGVSATDISEAMYQAISATGDTANALTYVEQSAKLAKGGFTDVTTALDGVTSVMNAYGETGEEAFSKVSDLMVTTQNEGKTTVDELAASLSNVIPTASAMGVSFEQVSAGLATMTAQGTPTAQATTQLNSLFAELGKSGTVAANNLEAAAEGTKYAGQSFTEMMDSGASLNEVMLMMSDHAEDNGLALLDMFSSVEAGKGALQIASGDGEKFANSLEAMSDAAGATDTAYATMESGIKATVERIKNTFSNLTMGIGEKLAPTINKMLSWVDTNLPAIVSSVEGAIDIIVSALSPFVEGIKTIISTVQLANGETNTAFTAIKNCISTVITGVQTVVQGFVELFTAIWSKWGDDITAYATTAWNNISAVIGSVINIITGIIDTFIALINGDWQGFLDGLLSIATNVWELIKTLFITVTDALKMILSTAFEAMKTAALTIFTALWNGLKSIFNSIQTWFQGAWNGLVTWLSGLAGSFYNAATTIFTSLWNGLKSIWESVSTWVSESFNGIVTTITDFGSNLYDAGVSIFTSLWDGIKSVWTSISTWVSEKVSWIANKLTFWRSSQAEMSSGCSASLSGVEGSFATGLSYVPHDEFLCLLHKGERVLTAEQNAAYSGTKQVPVSSGGSFSCNMGGVHLHEVQNVDSFADAIIKYFPGKMQQALYSRS